MRRPLRPWAIRTILVLDVLGMVLLVGVLGVSWKAGQDLIHPQRDLNPATPSSIGLDWSWGNTTTSDGIALAAWWMPADSTPGNNITFVFLHGYGDAKAQGLEVFPLLHRLGNVYAFDFRAHGASGGSYTTAGKLEVADVQAALGWINARQPQPSRIVLLGWSMGGATALNWLGQWGDLAPTFGVRGAITDGAFSRLTRIVETSIGKFTGLPQWPFGVLATGMAGWSIGERLEENAPFEVIRRYHGPLLLIQGSADTTVTPEQVDALAGAAKQATVWKVPGAAHVESLKTDPVGYEAHLRQFVAGLP